MSLFIACILLYAHGFSWPWYVGAVVIYGFSFYIRQEHYGQTVTLATMQGAFQAMDNQHATVMAAIRSGDVGLSQAIQKAEEAIRKYEGRNAELQEEVRILRYQLRSHAGIRQ